jgi:agmatinase
MTEAFLELGMRSPASNERSAYRRKPKLLTLGGDHSILLPVLRALNAVHNRPISVLHFDAHMDTRDPAKYLTAWIDHTDPSTQSFFNHGSMLWLASREGLIAENSSVHAGLRARVTDYSDFEGDDSQGWHRIFVDDIDDVGTAGILERIFGRIGRDELLYVSVDIDVIDPGQAPGTGTPEPGGWTMRELLRILRGLEGLSIIGADIVEVNPSYDTAEITALAASQIAFELLTNMVKRGLEDIANEDFVRAARSRDEL